MEQEIEVDEDFPTIEEYEAGEVQAQEEYAPLLEAIILKQFSVHHNRDYVSTVFVKNPTAALAGAIQSLGDYADRVDDLQALYDRARANNPAIPEMTLADQEAGTLKAFLDSMGQTIRLSTSPPEADALPKIFSKQEMSLMGRDTFINGFVQNFNVGELLGSMGCGGDYQPSPEVLEIAAITAAMVLSAMRKMSSQPQIVTATAAPGQLYNPSARR